MFLQSHKFASLTHFKKVSGKTRSHQAYITELPSLPEKKIYNNHHMN